MIEGIIPILISFVVAFLAFGISKIVVNYKLKDLHGNQKILSISVIVIIFGELLFLGLTYGLFDFALEIVASIGVGMVILGISFQNTLKNWVSGIGIFFNSDVNLGDTIQIKDVKGKIIKTFLISLGRRINEKSIRTPARHT